MNKLLHTAITLKNTFLEHVNYAKSHFNAEDINALNEFYTAIENAIKEQRKLNHGE